MKTNKLLIVCLAIVFALSLVVLAACHEHDYSAWEHDDTQHWKVCADDGAINESTRANHRLTNGVCECGFTHEHDYSVWRYDDTHHWKVCSREGDIDQASKAEHNFVNRKCECGAETPHEHDFTGWGYDANEHWRVCPEDNAADKTSYAAHVWDENCTCECGATNHDLSFAYTSETAPAPVAEGGALATTCSKCSATVNVAYNYGITDAVAKLSDNGRYYVSSSVSGEARVQFEIVNTGSYTLTFTDIVSGACGISVRVDGQMYYQYSLDIYDATIHTYQFDKFDRDDIGKTVEIKFEFNDVAVVPFVLIDFTAPDPAPVTNFVAHFYNSNSWSAVYVYTWENDGAIAHHGAWPGTQVSGPDADGWYTVYVNVTEGSWNGTKTGLGVIFNDGNGTQTGDCMPTQSEVWITIDNELFYTKAEAEEHLTKLTPVPSSAYILVGQIAGANCWQETTTSWSRVFSSDKANTLTVTFSAGDAFKVKLNSAGWEPQYGYEALSASGADGVNISGLFSEGENANIEVSKACTCNITFNGGVITVVVTAIL